VRPVRFYAGLSSWLGSDHHRVLRAILLPYCRYSCLAVSYSTSRRDHRPAPPSTAGFKMGISSLAIHPTAFTRQRSLIRSHHSPLEKSKILQVVVLG
jgi:hypothetical protein